MIDANETFYGTWPYAPHFFDGNGFRMHYVDENPSAQESFLCVHGEPTWGYLYRNIIPRLAKHGRVVVPDQMGFGKSEAPQGRRYTIEEHCNNLEKLVLALDLTNITLVMQDWGGPIGSSIAYRHMDFVIACFKDMWPARPVVTLPGVGHFLQEDAPEAVSAPIEQFVQMT